MERSCVPPGNFMARFAAELHSCTVAGRGGEGGRRFFSYRVPMNQERCGRFQTTIIEFYIQGAPSGAYYRQNSLYRKTINLNRIVPRCGAPHLTLAGRVYRLDSDLPTAWAHRLSYKCNPAQKERILPKNWRKRPTCDRQTSEFATR